MSAHGVTEKVVRDYERFLRSWASEKTTGARVALARRLLTQWGLGGFTEENVQDFLAGPPRGGDKKPWSRWTKATYYGHMKDLCKWLAAAELIPVDPMADVRSVKRPGNNPNPLSEYDADRVVATATGLLRDWVNIALQSGLRAHEIAKLCGEDVTPDGIRVEGKGGTNVTLPCHEDLWEMAQRYPRRGYWFPGTDEGHIPAGQLSARVSAFFTELGISGGIHRCRHLYCTRLIRNGENIRRVQALMRHATLETTAAYAAVDEDEMRSAVNRLPRIAPPPAA